MASTPTIGQQRALAYVPKPFAILSFLSSSYVIHHLYFQRPEKRQRLYHRLVFAMNLAVLPLSLAYFYGNWAVPVGTPGYVGAVGNVQSCTAFGFIAIMMSQTVPIYYGSLGLQSFMAMRNKFKEENYAWIEKWIHLVAWTVPCALTIVPAATENINPSGADCHLSKAPRGCESDPGIPCERGRDITWFVDVFGMGQILLYFFFPPAGVLGIFSHLKRIQKRFNDSSSSGMQLIRKSAQKKVLHNVAVQISVYLLSFWSTFAIGLICTAYQMVTGNILYDLLIVGNVVFSSQGFVMAAVYFALERMGRRDPKPVLPQGRRASLGRAAQLTVSDIRKNAEARGGGDLPAAEPGKPARDSPDVEPEEPVTFHIFDGTPDENSPWAMYFDESGDEDDDAGTEDGMT